MIINCWDRLQGFKVTPLLQVKSKVSNHRPGLLYTFCLRQMIEIFVLELKALFLFFKILIRYWDSGVQSYLTSACKIFGVPRRVLAEKCSYRSTKKANVFKAKKLIERGGSIYVNQVPWSPQQTIPDHRLYLSIQLQKFLSRTHSRFLYMSLCAWVCVCMCVCEWVSVWVCEFVYVS